MLKFAFWIRNCNGHKVNGITIMARDREDAERKLRQMYRYCEVIRCDIRFPKESLQKTETREDTPADELTQTAQTAQTAQSAQ